MASKINLGSTSQYPDRYDPSLLTPIPRSNSRESLFSNGAIPYTGVDLWTAYELSWLDGNGKPVVAIAEFEFPCDSINIVESKSFKYYLNSLNQTKYENIEVLQSQLEKDLSEACGADMRATILPLSSSGQFDRIEKMPGYCVDQEDVEIQTYSPDAGLLEADTTNQVQNEQLFSHLLKSNCPVTGQPDWASLWIEYSGAKISAASLLRYVVSFRQHQDFHENCVEKIFNDVVRQCNPGSLSVYARYTRRGGLDINPFRTNCDRSIPFRRLSRQ